LSQPPSQPSLTPAIETSQRDVLALDPVPTLLNRVAGELSADFAPGTPMRVSRAPGRLDVMGGIADYTGSLVCEATLDRAAAVALQPRADRNLQVFSFNLFDESQPFTFRIPIDSLAEHSIEELHREFNQPGRRWAGYIAGCLAILQEQGALDLKNPAVTGLSIALYSTVPLGAGVSSSAAVEVATMINLMDHFNLRGKLATGDGQPDVMRLAVLCQQVENRVVGAPCGIMDQVSSCAGETGALLRMVCQPHELLPPLHLPAGVRVVGINSNVKHSVGGGMYGKTRCAAFMGHKIILAKMREMGVAAGRGLISDPMRGYLANLDPQEYKKFFRPYLPEQIVGSEFLAKFGPTIDCATEVDPTNSYHVLQATDHHVLEARRVTNFVGHLQEAAGLPEGSRERKLALDKAGHLMYASHLSYTNDALLGAPECDLIVDLVRQREYAGFYGAKITGGGSGGTVAVLAEEGARSDAALGEILQQYEMKTGRRPELFPASSPGAWQAGTREISLAPSPPFIPSPGTPGEG
jgi:galactokinase